MVFWALKKVKGPNSRVKTLCKKAQKERGDDSKHIICSQSLLMTTKRDDSWKRSVTIKKKNAGKAKQ